MKVIYNDGHVAECAPEEELHILRHSAAHILAQAVKNLYPQAHFAYGPATENGFYYDIDLGDVKLTEEDLPAIEKEMQAIVKKNLPIKPFALSRDEAIKLMEERGENYKVEHISDLAEDVVRESVLPELFLSIRISLFVMSRYLRWMCPFRHRY